jgi:hypothetical protein
VKLLEKWRELEDVAGINTSQRVALTALRQYIGIDASGNWVFFSISDIEPEIWPEVGPITVEKRSLNDNWHLVLTLVEDEFKQEFSYLCEDLAEKVKGIDDEATAIKSQKEAFEDWIEFFKSSREFSAEKARGLFGELTFMLGQLTSGLTPQQVVSAWQGPLGAPQDFVFDDFKAFEVKTIQPQVSSIRIANEQQLSFPGELYLKIYRIQSSEFSDRGTNLNSLVEKIEGYLDAGLLREFRARIHKLGYTPESKFAQEAFFLIGEEHLLDVDRVGFPRLIHPTVPLGVHSVEYKISLSAIIGKGFDVIES